MNRIVATIRVMTRQERLVFLGAIIILAAACLTKIILYTESNSYIAGAAGGELREGVVGQPAFINPVVPATEADRDISRLVFSSVTDVADSIKVSADNKNYAVRLKENVFWSDGAKLTADDIIFTVQTIQDPESHSPLYQSFQGVQASRVSELEVKFSLASPYAFFQDDHLKNLSIIPKHIFAGVPVQNLQYSLYGLRPVGSGPYIAKGYSSDDRGDITSLTLKANKNYFGEKPKIDTITFKFYANTEELIKAYNKGAIDAFGISTYDPVLSNLVLRHKAHYLPTYRYYAIFINPTSAQKELQDIKVRQALSGLTDRAAILNKVLDGHGHILYGPTDLSPNPYPDFDKTLVQNLQLTLTVPDEPFLKNTAELIKSQWEAAGAQVNLDIKSLKEIQEQTIKNADCSLLLFGNITKPSEDLFSFWHSSQRFYPDQNLAFYQNKNVDLLLVTYRHTFDSKQRSEILKQISDEIAGDIPSIFLYSPDYVYIATPNLGGFSDNKPISITADRFSDVTSWYVRTRRVFR
jgi:peptide/nickel transport system substrate-binding protein